MSKPVEQVENERLDVAIPRSPGVPGPPPSSRSTTIPISADVEQLKSLPRWEIGRGASCRRRRRRFSCRVATERRRVHSDHNVQVEDPLR